MITATPRTKTRFRDRSHFVTRIVAAWICLSIAAQAQAISSPETRSGSSTSERFGIFGDLGINIHNVNVLGIPGIPSCSYGFQSATGIGPTFGLLYERHLGNKVLGGDLMMGLRAAFVASNATLATDEILTVELEGEATDVISQHRIATTLGSLSLMPQIGWKATNALTLCLGGELGWMVVRDYDQREQLSDDERRGRYDNGRRVRNESAGAIPGAANVSAAFQLAASYELPLNAARTFFAAPEIVASLGLTPIIPGESWRAHAVRVGLALKYAPRASSPTPLTPITNVVPQIGSVRAVGLDPDDREESIARLRVEELLASHTLPLLGYVFFDEGNATIPSRYVNRTVSLPPQFAIDRLHSKSTLESYHELLNIVGLRMRERGASTITLTGTNSGVGIESGNRALSQARAEAVRRYLIEHWQIEESRISVEAEDLPSVPSRMSIAEGIAENRRVEISSSDPLVLAPIRTSDTVRTTNPYAIRFHLTSSAPIASWRLTASQGGIVLKDIAGEGDLPPLIDWHVEGEEGSVPRAPGTLEYQLSLVGADGQTFASVPASLPVEQLTVRSKRRDRIADAIVEQYNLIHFNYDRAELSAAHRQILEEIRMRITPTALVTITGYTDRIGDDEHNTRLGLERAQTVARELRLPADRVELKGATEPILDQTLPEGRFHSRGVEIRIATPIEGDDDERELD